MITKKHLDALIASRFDLLKSKDIFKNNLEALRESIKVDLSSLAELSLIEVATKRFHFFSLDYTRPEDFQERIIEVDQNKFIMAGIRFRGLNKERPFISVYANFEIKNNHLSEIATLINKEFSLFKPQAFQFHSTSEKKFEREELEVDHYTLVGQVHEIVKEELPIRKETIELKEIHALEFYNEYLEEYKLFHRKNPDLIDEVNPESLEDLKEAMDNALIYQILIDNKTAGMIAASFTEYNGIKSIYIKEEILYDTFKGFKFGVYLQKEFAKKINGRGHFLWGTIAHLNQVSLKTALRNGRKIEEISYFYKL